MGHNYSEWVIVTIDDDPDNITIIEMLCNFHQMTVHTASSGIEGLEVLQNTPNITAVLLDLSMPGMDGWTLIREIRGTPDLVHLPVIAITAHAMRGDRERVLEAGFDRYLAKPISLMELLATLDEVVNG